MGFRTWFYKTTGIKLKKMNEEINEEINEEYTKEKQINLENYVGPGCYIHETSTTGKYTYLNDNTKIFPNVNIGKFCSIGFDVIIAPYTHPVEWLSTHPFQCDPAWYNVLGVKGIDFNDPSITTIKNDVWIGARAVIKRGIVIGNGAIIGSCAMVTKDVPDYAIVVGNPAKVIRYRFSQDIIDKLLKLEWWNLPIEKLNGIIFNDIDKAIVQLSEIKTMAK